LTTPAGNTVYYVVQADTHDADDLSATTDEDRQVLSDIVPMRFVSDPRDILRGPGQPVQLWWWVLVGFIGLLCFEVWMTRKIAVGRGKG